MTALPYRADIDGLRAVAVVPIVLFHCGVSLLPGGFVGVDIFFVISGFLITAILTREMDERRFSLLAFYRRRIVRILPALLVVVAVTLAAGAALLLPSEIRALGRSAAATAGFGSNIYFWRDVGYFGAAADAKPLLHSWSLGVEEQFYLFYPVLIPLLRRVWPQGLRAAVAVATLASFGIGLFLAERYPSAGFFLLPSRAWELGLGALVALGALPPLGARARSFAAAAGFALILLGYGIIRANFAFPAPWALLPCGGASLLIAYGKDAWTAPLLSAPPMRALGRISYSLYLWHWPIITFHRLLYSPAPGVLTGVLLLLASLVAALLSYHLIEQPFLRRFRDARALPVCLAGLAALAATAGGALAVSANAARFGTIPPDVARVASYLDYRYSPEREAQFGGWSCFFGRRKNIASSRCFALDPARRNLLLLGDSHAAQFARALAERQPELHLVQATAAGCRPILGSAGDPECAAMVETALGPFLDRGRVRDVVLAGRWRATELDAVTRTVHMLRARGMAVTVLGPIVEYDDDFPKLLARAMLRHDTDSLAAMRDPRRAALDRAMEPRILAAGARYISMQRLECPPAGCHLTTRDGAPYKWDYGHFTLPAARELAAQFPRF